jgi:predicted ATPase
MQFMRLKLSNWRNFSGIDIQLAPRMFIIGPNASGKSNLLDVFRFLRDIAKPGGGFQKAVRDRGGVSSLRCLAARRYSDITVEVHVDNQLGIKKGTVWRYRITFNQDKQRIPVIKEEIIWKKEDKILSRPDENDKKDIVRLTQTNLEQVNVNQEFRELVRYFESVQYLHLVPHIIRDPGRSTLRSGDPFGSDFLERLAVTPEKTRRARLRVILDALKVAVPQLKELHLERDDRGTPHLKALYEHWRPLGAWQNEMVFSDGTLRFLGFLWALLDGQGPLLLEEPELSLHPGIVRRLASVIYRFQKAKERQILVSTHSSELVSDKGISGEEVVLLQPTKNGTQAIVGKDDQQIKTLLREGASVADVVIPATEPKDSRQLELFKG